MTTAPVLGTGYDNLTGADLDRITRRLSTPGTAVCTQAGDCARRDALTLAGEVRRLRLALALLTVRHADLLAHLDEGYGDPGVNDDGETLHCDGEGWGPDAPIAYQLTHAALACTAVRGWTV